MTAGRNLVLGLSILHLFLAICFGQSGKESLSITLSVDATEASRRILHAKETIPVKPGPLTLVYPKWIPGEHGPTGAISDLVGLKITAASKAVTWRRDLVDMYAINVQVPSGSTRLELAFDFLLSPSGSGFSSAASSSEQLVVVSWNQVVLYPKGLKSDEITIVPNLALPRGWNHASALRSTATQDGVITFAPASLTMLVDSPVLAGRHFRRIDLTSSPGPSHALNVAADSDIALDMTPQQMEAYKRLVTEALALFRSHHYEHYDFLYTLSDQVAHFGLEHHQSSDNRVSERTLIDPDLRKVSSGLLPHEFVHSWNGKFRRPAGLATGDFSSPMKGDLLWVYEGLTQYLGKLLTARSGLLSQPEFREDLAQVAARLDNQPGRRWRPLQDTADAAQILYGMPDAWASWRRGVDFYDESVLIWLEADVTIRELTGGKKSLDDFCRLFHGGESNKVAVKPYIFEDVVAALNEIARHDWTTFLQTRLRAVEERAPLTGLTKSGWKLVYKETRSSMQESAETARKYIDLRYSLGLLLKEDGTIADVIPGSTSDKAGVGPGMKLIAVNGRQYSKETVRKILSTAKQNTKPLELLVSRGEFFRTYHVDYHGGERYPHLERDPSTPDVLSLIIEPLMRGAEGQKNLPSP